jgi:cyclic pyranopterin phosphate synthase
MAKTPDRRGVRPARLTHVDARGRARMVDVGSKPSTAREAVARGTIRISAAARRLIRAGTLRKGDPFETARLAGILAAKRTADLIPLCHPLPLTYVDVTITPNRNGYAIESRVRTTAETGVEMEALTAVAVAALTIYDMVKAADKGMAIGDIELREKRGGKETYKKSEVRGQKSEGKGEGRRQKAEAGRQKEEGRSRSPR